MFRPTLYFTCRPNNEKGQINQVGIRFETTEHGNLQEYISDDKVENLINSIDQVIAEENHFRQ